MLCLRIEAAVLVMISDLTMKCDRNIFDAKGYLAQEIPIPPLSDRKKFDFPVV